MPNSEFDQDSDGSDDESSPPEPLLSQTSMWLLASASGKPSAPFYVLGTYYKVPGTFPIDSREAASASWRLVDEFLEQYGFPCTEDVSEWSCPRFVPQPRLMLVFKPDGLWQNVGHAELLPTVVAPAGTSLSECHFMDKREIPAFAPIRSSQRYSDPVLITDPPLLQHKAVYQSAHLNYHCTVGSVKDGPQAFLRPDSVEILGDLNLRAQEASRASLNLGEPPLDHGLDTPCHCHARSGIAKRLCTAMLRDIVIDFDRSAVNTIQDTEISSRALTFDQECHRILALLDEWVEWIYTR
jgi:hypothetical protein